MQNRLFKITASVATIGAMALGGAALASAATTDVPDPDNGIVRIVQPADAVDNDAIESATELGGVEEAESSESESAAEDDGPGGHEDDPTDANADHQFEGEE